MLYEWRSVRTPPSVVGKLISRQPKLVPTLKNHELSDREECQELQLLVFQWVRSKFDDDDEAVGRFPPRLFIEPSSLFEDRLHSRVLRCPRMLVLFAVLLVDCEELLYSLVESLPYVRRAISCILFSLEQSQVVD